MGKPRQLTLRSTKTTRGHGKKRTLFLKTRNRSLEVLYRLPRPWASADGTKRSQPSKAGVSPPTAQTSSTGPLSGAVAKVQAEVCQKLFETPCHAHLCRRQ